MVDKFSQVAGNVPVTNNDPNRRYTVINGYPVVLNFAKEPNPGGGNLGDVKRTLQSAQQLVNARVGAVLRCSHRYESAPWGFTSENRFSNQALELTTDLSPLEVLDACQAIERELGRNRAAEQLERSASGARYTSRPIDIDLIFYDDLVLETDRLTLPHPLLAEREFALVPLCEIMRQRRHPVLGISVGEMLSALRENHKTEKA